MLLLVKLKGLSSTMAMHIALHKNYINIAMKSIAQSRTNILINSIPYYRAKLKEPPESYSEVLTITYLYALFNANTLIMHGLAKTNKSQQIGPDTVVPHHWQDGVTNKKIYVDLPRHHKPYALQQRHYY